MRETIRRIAKSNNGLVTTKDAKAAGFSSSALRQYARRHDDVVAMGNGVYMDETVTPTSYEDMYFLAALKIAGEKSYLRGSTVLDFYNLGYAAPNKIQVSTPSRVRVRAPEWMDVKRRTGLVPTDKIRGIRLQPVEKAILESYDMKRSDLIAAVNEAEERNLVPIAITDELRHKLRYEAR